MADPFRFMSSEPAALISMREIEKRLANRKKAKPSEFQSQSQCSAGRYEKRQISLFNALNLDGSRRCQEVPSDDQHEDQEEESSSSQRPLGKA